MTKKTTSFQLDAALLAKLDEVVEQGDGNRSEVLRRLITRLVEDQALIAEIVSRKEVVSDTPAYLMVVLGSEWPRRLWTTLVETPFSQRLVANVARSEWRVNRFRPW